jgi:hypothetical protein
LVGVVEAKWRVMVIVSVCVKDKSNPRYLYSLINNKVLNLNLTLINKIHVGKQLSLLKKVAVVFSDAK